MQPSRSFLVILPLLLGVTAQAQQPTTTPGPETAQRDQLQPTASGGPRGWSEPDLRSVPATSHLLAGRPVSIGADYKATYSSAEVVFTPALGKNAPHTRLFTWSFESARVGSTYLQGLDFDVEPQLVGREVQYDRGQGLLETYLATGRGLKQSFVLEFLPDRAGELVVSGRFSSSMARDLASSGDRRLRFVEPGIATVELDTVVGFDADGREVDGVVRLVGDRLEFALPASFVAQAELPVVLDPLIGVEYLGSQAAFDSDETDIAFGLRDFVREYCLVFSRYYSATDLDVTAATFDPNGGTIKAQFAIEMDIGWLDTGAAVAFNKQEKTFVVAWQRQLGALGSPTIHATHFSSAFGGVQPYVDLGGGRQPDVGSERAGGNRAVCVFQTGDTVRTRDFTVSTNQPPILGTPATVFDASPFNNGYTRPCISKADNGLRLFLVGSEENFSPDRDLILAAVDAFGTPVSNSITVTSVGPDEERPDVAADLEDFFLVFEREAVAGNGDADIVGQKIDLVPETFGYTIATSGPEILVSAKPLDDEREPAVAGSRHEWTVVWQDQVGGTDFYDVYLATIGKDGCKICEPTQLVSTPVESNVAPEIASTFDGGAPVSEASAGVAYTRISGAFPERVYWRTWESVTGTTTFVANDDGCQDGGTMALGGVLDLGGYLSISVTGLPMDFGAAVLNLAEPGSLLSCSGCSIRNLGTTFIGTPVPFGGGAAATLPVPCRAPLQGLTVTFQWIVVGTPSSPCGLIPGVSASNTLEVTLGY